MMSIFSRLRHNDVARHGAIVFGGVAIANVFNYLYYVLVGRTGGVEIYGIVTSLSSAMLVVVAPATVVQIVVARLTADLSARGDRAAIRRLSDVVMMWTSVAAVAAVAVCLVLRNQLAAFFNVSGSGAIVVSAIGLGFLAVVTIQRGIFQGAHRFDDFSASMVIDCVVKVAIGVPLIAVFGAAGAMFGILASLALAAGYALFAFRRRFGNVRAPLALDRKLIARVVSHVGLGQFTFTVLMFYDVPLIKHEFDARTAGLYAAAALAGRAVLAAISFVPTLIMPKATARLAAGRSPLPLLGIALGISGSVVACAALAGLVAPRLVVTLLAGKAFYAAAPLVLPYIAASGALSLANVVAAYKMGLHRYNFVLPAAAVAIVEIATFAFWHPTIGTALTVLAGGHTAILGVTLLYLNERPQSVNHNTNPAAAASL